MPKPELESKPKLLNKQESVVWLIRVQEETKRWSSYSFGANKMESLRKTDFSSIRHRPSFNR